MTALDQYIRLEASGRWRESRDAPAREVLISFGNATLVLSDFDEQPLTHWSLAAVELVGHQGHAAVYAPDGGALETLSVTDPAMIEAIAEVGKMARLRNEPKKSRRLRRPILLGLLAAALAYGIFGLPGALRERAFALIPKDQADLIAEDVRARLGASPCALPQGIAALDRLRRQIAPETALQVMRWDAPLLARLSDGTVLVAQPLVAPGQSPEAAAGWIALAATLTPEDTALHGWTGTLSLPRVVRLLASGEIGPADRAAIAARIRAASFVPTPAQVAAARARLANLGIPDAPFLAALTSRIPFAPGTTQPVQTAAAGILLDDQDWVALTEICAR